jgi:hypothetical protein
VFIGFIFSEWFATPQIPDSYRPLNNLDHMFASTLIQTIAKVKVQE